MTTLLLQVYVTAPGRLSRVPAHGLGRGADSGESERGIGRIRDGGADAGATVNRRPLQIAADDPQISQICAEEKTGHGNGSRSLTAGLFCPQIWCVRSSLLDFIS